MQCAVALQQEGPEFEELAVSLDVLLYGYTIQRHANEVYRSL